MDAGAQIPPAQVPVSATPGNLVQTNADGIYVGSQNYFNAATVFYVNNSSGSDANAGSKSAPFATLSHALAVAASLFPDQQLAGAVTIALQAGQTFAFPSSDVNVYPGANLVFAFYGDPNYGDFNTLVSGTNCNSQHMSDLERPVITFNVTQQNAQWYMNGINRYGGSVSFLGVQCNLPAAPATPGISLYSIYCDVVRSVDFSAPGYVVLTGSIINMTDVTAYWGFIGTQSRSTNTSFVQFSSQFQINGLVMSAANAPTTAQLTARQYFIKMFVGFAGNNQVENTLAPNSSNSSTASGVLAVSWADTESLVVTGSKVSQASYPIMFDISYGFRNYIFGLQQDQQQRPLNVLSSRLF
jgi:hypothetical protein